jgi:RNA polymerase sigma-70 factor (ECF subfamily)
MSAQDLDQRITDIHTRWSKLLAPDHEIMRYYGAVHRYLLAMVGDPAVAEELANEFAQRFLAGKFAGADPQKVRLRDLIKAAARNLAMDYWRARQRAKKAITLDESKLADRLLCGDDDRRGFEAACRNDCLVQTWQALEGAEKADGKPYFTVLRLKVDNPKIRSEELARRLGTTLKKPMSAEAVRQTLHRARSLFADLLLDIVGRALGSADPDRLEEELVELELLDYCRSALVRRRKDRAR